MKTNSDSQIKFTKELSKIKRNISTFYLSNNIKFIEAVLKSITEITTRVSAIEKVLINQKIIKKKEVDKKQKELKKDLIKRQINTFGKIEK